MTKKVHNLAVKTGEYEKDGQTKGRYLNVGAMMEKEDGGRFILLDRTFNPAGLPNPDNRNNIIISMFPVEAQTQAPQQEGPPPANDDDIPF